MKQEISRFSESAVFEGMTSVRAVIESSKKSPNPRKILKILIDKGKISSKEKEIDYLKRMSNEMLFDIVFTSGDEIAGMTVGNSHGGIIAICSDRSIPPLERDLIKKIGFYVMIEGIEDPYNFGYAVRSIYAAGADGIILTPRNWMSAAGVVCRSSAGASELIPLAAADPCDAAELFRSCGYKIVSAGIRDSVSAYEADLSYPIFLIIGGEKRGISRKVLDMSDIIVRLDYGRKFNASLSAASASSILAYEVLRQNKNSTNS